MKIHIVIEWCFGITLRGKNIQVLETLALLQIGLCYYTIIYILNCFYYLGTRLDRI